LGATGLAAHPPASGTTAPAWMISFA
jgi:hypothetical protein